MPDATVPVPVDLVRAILAYLHTRPYAEVAQGVQRLEALLEAGNA